jgi:hypothetical protein
MPRNPFRRLAVVALLGLAAATLPAVPPADAQQGQPPAQSQAPPPGPEPRADRLDGMARLVLDEELPPEGTRHTFAVAVDLTDVRVVEPGIGPVPGVLGAYILGVRFDPVTVRLVEVRGGDSPGFQKAPVFTDPAKANAEGLVRFTGYQTRTDGPAGRVSVARVVLEVADPAGLKSVELLADSLASSIRRTADGRTAGPFAIPFEGKRLPRRSAAAPRP